MFEPMGLRVVDDVVYVTWARPHHAPARRQRRRRGGLLRELLRGPRRLGQLPRLQLRPADGQREGNFYYAKSGQYTDFEEPGAILRVAPDGKSWTTRYWCTGLRTPNGMGMSSGRSPAGQRQPGQLDPRLEGQRWSRKGGFYGVFPAIDDHFAGQAARATDFDQPVLWMPQAFDSSSGGQLWVDDPRFGPARRSLPAHELRQGLDVSR